MNIKHLKRNLTLAQELMRTSFSPRKELHEAYQKRGALSMPRTFVLMLLMHEGQKSMKELTYYSQMVLPVVSAMVNDLEKDKLVKRERSKSDKRIVTVHITDKGRKILLKQIKFIEEIMESMLNRLTKKEQIQYVHLSKKMYGDYHCQH